MLGLGVGQGDDGRAGPHDPPRGLHHRRDDVPQLEVRYQRIRQLEQEREPMVLVA
jgi:hypothetical protein